MMKIKVLDFVPIRVGFNDSNGYYFTVLDIEVDRLKREGENWVWLDDFSGMLFSIEYGRRSYLHVSILFKRFKIFDKTD